MRVHFSLPRGARSYEQFPDGLDFHCVMSAVPRVGDELERPDLEEGGEDHFTVKVVMWTPYSKTSDAYVVLR